MALLVAIAVSATLLITYLLWTARQDALSAGQVTALNYARTIQVRLDATFRRADSVLATLAQSTPVDALRPQAEERYAGRLNGELDSMLREFEELIALRIIDDHGDQRYVSSAGTKPAANYADRAFFKRYVSDPRAELLFSDVVTGRVSRQPTIVITRPLRDGQGRFYGAVLAPLDLSFFETQFKKLDTGRHGAIFLRQVDSGSLVLRWPPIDAEANTPMPASHPIMRAVRSGKAESVDRYVAFTDGVRRISGTVTTRGYPFFLTVALSEDDLLVSWRRLALLTGVTWSVLIVLLGVLAWRLRRTDIVRVSLEAQLRESQRIESIGTLAGGIAHDFNNILAVILGNAALAGEEISATHPARKSLEQIRKASLRARDLVQQILAFGRRQPQALVNQSLQPLVQEALALLRSTLPASVELHGVLASEPIHVRADATQIQQVLMNLCTNAWHALQGRPGRIVVGLEALPMHDVEPGGEAPPGMRGWAHLWVEDDGTGMDAATRARIFEPFFTTKPPGEGTGLGLSVVHGIVAEHRGSIRVDSEPGRGTTVHLFFPTADPQQAPAPVPQSAALVSPPRAPTDQHVMVVDDDEVVVLMVARLLARAGFRATSFSDGRAAVAAVRADPQTFDLVVTDYNMPGFSGIEVAKSIGAIRSELPVVISSGYISEDLIAQASAAGVRSVMQKQNTLEELVDLVRSLVPH